MGRAKKKRVAKRRKRMFNRNSIRAKMGKPVFFTLTHCNKKMSGISNKYNYKANMHKLCFVGARFYNVKYQASIMTDCNYRDANIIGVDYFNCNMRGTSFKNTRFKNTVFFNCKILQGLNLRMLHLFVQILIIPKILILIILKSGFYVLIDRSA